MEQERILDGQLDRVYNPVTVSLTETTGIVALTLITLILLFELLRSQKRIRELQEQFSPVVEE